LYFLLLEIIGDKMDEIRGILARLGLNTIAKQDHYLNDVGCPILSMMHGKGISLQRMLDADRKDEVLTFLYDSLEEAEDNGDA
jgi:hypothetical protein